MKFLGKLFLVIVAIFVIAILAAGIFLQTRWGAGWVASQVNKNSDYFLSIGNIDHNWSSPSHIILRNVTFGPREQSATLTAKTIDLGISTRQVSEIWHFDTILLQDGTLDLDNRTARLPVLADVLQLSNMKLSYPHPDWPITAEKVTGGIKPWQPQEGYCLGTQASIQLSAATVMLDGIPANNVLLEGSIDNNKLVINNIGADIARGSLTGDAQRDEKGQWKINNLRLDDIRLQTPHSLADFFHPLLALPSVEFGRVDVTDARLEGTDWAMTDVDFSLRNLTLKQGDWQSQDGKLSMNASDIIKGSLHLRDPVINADFSPQGIALRQFTSRWEGGMVRASGNWLRDGKRLALDEMVVAGLEYTLPEDWRDIWSAQLPGWLNTVDINRFSVNRSLLIDINSTFPFQITALDANGAGLTLVNNRQWGIWKGALSMNAAEATFNRTDMRRPSLTLNASNNAITTSETSAFVGQGMLEGSFTLTQTPQRNFTLSLSGKAVPLNVLQNWGWPALPVSGDGNLQMAVTGQLAASTPLKPTVSGNLSATDMSGQKVQQTMQNGVVAGTQ